MNVHFFYSTVVEGKVFLAFASAAFLIITADQLQKNCAYVLCNLFFFL